VKYAAFIWGAYGASAAAFAWMVIDTLVRGRIARRALEALERAPDR
jgi:heme exporter protein CcmD